VAWSLLVALVRRERHDQLGVRAQCFKAPVDYRVRHRAADGKTVDAVPRDCWRDVELDDLPRVHRADAIENRL